MTIKMANHRRRRKFNWLSNVFQKVMLLLLLTILTKSAEAGGVSLKGGDLSCSQPDGREVQVNGITDTARFTIKCICLRGVVKCERQMSSCAANLQGCHYVDNVIGKKSGHGSCPQECRGCTVNGTKYESGKSWKDGLQMHECFSGVLTTTPEISCPAPECSNPLPGKDGGCPSCSGCSRAGTIYAEGETKPDISNPCNECSCSRGRLTCIRKSCPVLPCLPRVVKNMPGQCCPVCARVEPAFTEIVQKNKCLFRGQQYSPGQVVKQDNCIKCTCSQSLTLECSRLSCPELFCPLANQRRAPDECCPFCLTSSTQMNLPALRPEVTEVVRAPIGCTYKGITYSSGKTWQDGCDSCTCNLNGKTECTAPTCPDKCPPGSQMVKKEGSCCPQCELKEGVCTVFGDPHYKTFDGRIFNFQGSCKYLLAQDCEKKKNSSFSIRITNDARDSLAFSWTRTITVRLAGIKVSLLQRMRVKIDGKRVSLPYIKLGALSVMKDGYRVVLRTHEGVRILWDGVSFLELTVPPKFRNKICGLCGNFNGDPRDDFYGRKGKNFKDGQHFGDSWRVGGMRACSILPRDMPRSYEPHCTQSWESRISSVRYCNALNSTLFDKCRAKVDPKYYFNACRLDMCECPGDQCHCEVLTAYARECERAGFMVHNWREPTGCRNVTSFRYSGTNQISREDSDDDDNDVESSDKNEVLMLSTNLEELPPSKFVSTGLGDFLPACSPDNSEHCEPSTVDSVDSELKKKAKKKPKLTKQERREKRRKEKQRQKKREERLKRKERRRLKRLREKERRERLKKNRKNKNKNKFVDDEDEDYDDETEDGDDYHGVVVQQVQGDDGDRRRKLSWTKFERGKPPPFEFLLTSSPALSGSSTGQKEVEAEEEDYPVDQADLVHGSFSPPQHSRVRAGGRVPLPLLDGRPSPLRDSSSMSDSSETLPSDARDDRTLSESDLPSSQREVRRNWKTTRRRNDQQ